jgi:hypothetical protein
LAVLLAIVPLAMWALRLSKRYRRTANMAASLLLIFGMNVKVDPPPPPRIEVVQDEDEEAPPPAPSDVDPLSPEWRNDLAAEGRAADPRIARPFAPIADAVGVA